MLSGYEYLLRASTIYHQTVFYSYIFKQLLHITLYSAIHSPGQFAALNVIRVLMGVNVLIFLSALFVATNLPPLRLRIFSSPAHYVSLFRSHDTHSSWRPWMLLKQIFVLLLSGLEIIYSLSTQEILSDCIFAAVSLRFLICLWTVRLHVAFTALSMSIPHLVQCL